MKESLAEPQLQRVAGLQGHAPDASSSCVHADRMTDTGVQVGTSQHRNSSTFLMVPLPSFVLGPLPSRAAKFRFGTSFWHNAGCLRDTHLSRTKAHRARQAFNDGCTASLPPRGHGGEAKFLPRGGVPLNLDSRCSQNNIDDLPVFRCGASCQVTRATYLVRSTSTRGHILAPKH